MSTLAHIAWASFEMLWGMFWALVLGFFLSAVVQAFVPKQRVAALLGQPGIRQLGLAVFLGAVSSSCSYAAASVARALFEKKAHIVCAFAFMFASTNLVLELSVVVGQILGWQFVVAEALGALVLVAVMVGLMLVSGPLRQFEERRESAGHSHNGHLHHETSEIAANPKTREGWTAAAQAFVGEVGMIGRDILLGVVLSGAVMVLVPQEVWAELFFSSHGGALRELENVFVGPILSVLSFVCSIGNIPLASVLYSGGLSFGGTLSFIYADLIVFPLLLVYRRYYGWKLAMASVTIFYLSMVGAGWIVGSIFTFAGWVPEPVPVQSLMSHRLEWNYTAWLNVAFGMLAIAMWVLSRQRPASAKACCHH